MKTNTAPLWGYSMLSSHDDMRSVSTLHITSAGTNFLCGMFAFSTVIKRNWKSKQSKAKTCLTGHITIFEQVLKICVRLAWRMFISLIQHGKCHFKMAEGHNYYCVWRHMVQLLRRFLCGF